MADLGTITGYYIPANLNYSYVEAGDSSIAVSVTLGGVASPALIVLQTNRRASVYQKTANSYTFSGLRAGDYLLQAKSTADNTKPMYAKEITLGASDDQTVNIEFNDIPLEGALVSHPGMSGGING